VEVIGLSKTTFVAAVGLSKIKYSETVGLSTVKYAIKLGLCMVMETYMLKEGTGKVYLVEKVMGKFTKVVTLECPSLGCNQWLVMAMDREDGLSCRFFRIV